MSVFNKCNLLYICSFVLVLSLIIDSLCVMYDVIHVAQVHSSKGASAASSPPKKKRTHKKQNNGYDASNEPIGFERGYEAEEIIGATDLDSQIMFNIKW